MLFEKVKNEDKKNIIKLHHDKAAMFYLLGEYDKMRKELKFAEDLYKAFQEV